MKNRILKDKIRAAGACLETNCPACNAELEVIGDELPALAREAGPTRDLAVMRAEKAAAETRATGAEERASMLLGDVARFIIATATRDVDGLVGVKIDPSEREAELKVATAYIETGMRLVPLKDDKGAEVRDAQNNVVHEYEGLIRWNERLATLKARKDIGLVGRSHVTPRPETTPARGEARTTNAGGTPPGGPPVKGGVSEIVIDHGPIKQRATTAGSAFAKRIARTADQPDPVPHRGQD